MKQLKKEAQKMSFINQVLAEMTNTLRSKFILFSAILIFLFMCIALPFISVSSVEEELYNSYEGIGIISVDGQTIEIVNAMQFELYNAMEFLKWTESYSDNEKTVQYLDDYYNIRVEYLKDLLPYFTEPDYGVDYRTNIITLKCHAPLAENFILEQIDPDIEALTEASYRFYYEPAGIEALLIMTDEEKQAKILENKQFLKDLDSIAKNNDYAKYVEIQTKEYNASIAQSEQIIKELEESLLKDKSKEKYVAEQIAHENKGINTIKNEILPEFEYRLEHNIMPNDGSWQDTAINQVKDCKLYIYVFDDIKLSENDFLNNKEYVDQYKNYEIYLLTMERELEDTQFKLMVLENSLKNNKPDMSAVPDGARNALIDSFNAIFFINVFAILVGACAIAPDFQNGKIRLLMIRPRSRETIFFSRYIANLVITIALYLLVYIVTLITKGIQFGFDDYLNPNYLASGEISFFIIFIGKLFISSISIIFLYTLAFAFSTIVRNVAVSVIVPQLHLLDCGCSLIFGLIQLLFL